MSVARGPSIVKNGLALCLDAADKNSYPGSGTAWYNLVGNGCDLTKINTPTYTVLNGTACWRFDSDGDYFLRSYTISPNLNSFLDSSDLTVEAGIYLETDLTVGDRATVIVLAGAFYHSINKSNRKLSNYWYGKLPAGYHETGDALSNNVWYHTASVWNNTDGKIYQYLNTTKTSASTSGTGSLPANSLVVGRETSARQFAGYISFVRVYNRALSDSEILQNYNATKGRFGK